jgi:hypothetical protein
MSDSAGRTHPGSSEPAPEGRSLLARVAVIIAVVIALALLVPLLVKVFVPPINPAQKTPPGHFATQCGWCHDVSASVKMVDE